VVFLLIPQTAESAFSISASPAEGGNSLRFGRANLSSAPDKEVKIRITSTESRQYQVFQRIVETLTNERGETISPSAILTATLPDSNASGTLYMQSQEHVGYSDQLIYTSSANGNTDSFSVIYRVDTSRLAFAGNFFGKIMYLLRPIGGSAQQEVILNIFLEASQELVVEAEAGSGIDFIRLNSTETGPQEDELKISFRGNGRNGLKIYQEILDFPVNEMNDELQPEILYFSTFSNTGDTLNTQSLKNFQRGKVLIYESNDDSDIFLVKFSLNSNTIDTQKAGNFSGKIQYTVQRNDYNKIIDLNLNVEIAPVFKLAIDYPPEGVSFKNMVPTAPPQKQEVLVKVNTNLGRPYIITQTVEAPLTNEEGKQITDDTFSMKQEVVSGNIGKFKYSDFHAVQAGESQLYYSDNYGSPVEFKVIYRLEPSWELEAGNYKTSIVYSLGEI
jgi:hypothetical protein